jgi:short subunit dehydrogenase-like uncharacterized protein
MGQLDQIGANRALAKTFADPFALTPGFSGPRQPEGESAQYDEHAKSWSGPFVMAAINTKNVHRTNALRGHPWGTDFLYDERMLTRDGVVGAKLARALARTTRVQNLLLGFGPSRALIRRFAVPQPGQGPNQRQRETGRYEVIFSGETASGQHLQATVKGDRDPGYGSTCKLITEAALCLARDVGKGAATDAAHKPAAATPNTSTGPAGTDDTGGTARTPGGVWTPGAAMGLALVRRLHARAGLTFSID